MEEDMARLKLLSHVGVSGRMFLGRVDMLCSRLHVVALQLQALPIRPAEGKHLLRKHLP